MDTAGTTLSLSELEQRLHSPEGLESFSTLTNFPFLLLDLTGPVNNLRVDHFNLLSNVLTQLPCPVLAIVGDQPSEGIAEMSSLAQATESIAEVSSLADVIVASEKDAQSIINNIRKHPLAAMTLVQLLRHNERASIADGLFAESLAYATLQGGGEFKSFLADRQAKESSGEPSTERSSEPSNQKLEPAVKLARREDLLTITLNRPQHRNAYSTAMRDGLIEGLQLLASDGSINKAIIEGAGSCFCTGGDLEEFGQATDTANAHAIRSTRNVARMIAENAERIEFHVHRACIGSGIELPAFGGRVLATKDTLFQLPEITMGLIPGAGGTVSILKRIGRQKTAWLALSAKRINANTALDWGLIDEIG